MHNDYRVQELYSKPDNYDFFVNKKLDKNQVKEHKKELEEVLPYLAQKYVLKRYKSCRDYYLCEELIQSAAINILPLINKYIEVDYNKSDFWAYMHKNIVHYVTKEYQKSKTSFSASEETIRLANKIISYMQTKNCGYDEVSIHFNISVKRVKQLITLGKNNIISLDTEDENGKSKLETLSYTCKESFLTEEENEPVNKIYQKVLNGYNNEDKKIIEIYHKYKEVEGVKNWKAKTWEECQKYGFSKKYMSDVIKDYNESFIYIAKKMREEKIV